MHLLVDAFYFGGFTIVWRQSTVSFSYVKYLQTDLKATVGAEIKLTSDIRCCENSFSVASKIPARFGCGFMCISADGKHERAS